MQAYFSATPTRIDAFLLELDSAATARHDSDERFNLLMQQALVVATVSESPYFPAGSFVTCCHNLGIGASTFRRYVSGQAAPHPLGIPRVLRRVHEYLVGAVTARRAYEKNASDSLSAFNLSIQAPNFDSDAFFGAANEHGLPGAVRRAVQGFYRKPLKDDSKE